MNIGHITFKYKPVNGGEGRYISNLIKVLENQGHSQRVYQADMGVNSPELRLVKIPRFFLERGFNVYYPFNGLLPFRFLELRREDLLIINYAFHWLPVFWHKKVVIISHGVEWEEPPIRLNHKIRRWVARYTFKNSRLVLVANDTDYFRRMGIDLKPKERLFEEIIPNKWFIPNCVDIDHFQQNKGIDELKELNPILVPRAITPQRGIHLAVQAFSQFVKEFPTTNLVIVGREIDKKYKEGLVKLIDKLGLKNKIWFWGEVSREGMPAIYSSAFLTLIPSLFGEGTSLSALESMACRTAVVATDVGGLRDLPCVLAKPSVSSLSQTMAETFERRQEVAQRQCLEISKTYNLENWGKIWLKVIDSIGQTK